MVANRAKKRRTSPRVVQKRERSRREILEAAEALLREGGVDTVTLGSVAGELALTKQALYHYFPSKEALVKSLVVKLLDDEIEALIKAVDGEKSDARVLGTLIRAFYEDMLRHEINPRTRSLFDLLEHRLSRPSMNKTARAKQRRLAYSAWLAALGLITMLAAADAANDPLIHADKELLQTLSGTFDAQARNPVPA